ncbi:hypothetical protein ACQPZK_00260 [Micromonospora sp. CA-249363]|uniref:hypothetical protein n=1 Tax=Micromonospora sp. CA-249363 TaxID=3239963 RepID=UPI003D8B41D2
MARRGWGVSIATAVGVAAGAGAAQLGFGYGLGVITWTPTEAGANGTAWADGLAWATWLAASSTVLGAVCAQRLHQRAAPTATTGAPAAGAVADEADLPRSPALTPDPAIRAEGTDAAQDRQGIGRAERVPDERGGLLRRLSLALGAGLGGLVTVLLVAVPARVAAGADTGAPQRVAALHAALGILIGVIVALWALRSRTVAVNITATAAWLWLLAVVSVIDGVRVGRGLTGAQLGTWQLDPDHGRYWIGGQIYWPGALLALVPALLIGALAARGAVRPGGHRVGAAASGAAGPLLVALAYLTTVPRWAAPGPAQFSTQLIAPYAVIAGVAGSILVARLAERASRQRADDRRGTVPAVEPEPDPAPAGADAASAGPDAASAGPAARRLLTSTGRGGAASRDPSEGRAPASTPREGSPDPSSTDSADSTRTEGLDPTSGGTRAPTGAADGTRPGRRARSVTDAATGSATGSATRRGRTAATPTNPETQPAETPTTPPRVPTQRPDPDAESPTESPTSHRARPPRRPTT